MLHDLVERAKRGDRDAFTDVATITGDRLYAVAYRILRDPHRAEDTVQQVYLTAWRELPRLRDSDRVEAWLYRLLVHACYAEVRATKRWEPGLRIVPQGEAAVADETMGVVLRDELERGFRRLSGEQRVVLVLHYYLGMTGEEIGRLLGISAGTVRSRLHHARKVMRGLLEADARIPRPTEATGGRT